MPELQKILAIKSLYKNDATENRHRPLKISRQVHNTWMIQNKLSPSFLIPKVQGFLVWIILKTVHLKGYQYFCWDCTALWGDKHWALLLYKEKQPFWTSPLFFPFSEFSFKIFTSQQKWWEMYFIVFETGREYTFLSLHFQEVLC